MMTNNKPEFAPPIYNPVWKTAAPPTNPWQVSGGGTALAGLMGGLAALREEQMVSRPDIVRQATQNLVDAGFTAVCDEQMKNEYLMGTYYDRACSVDGGPRQHNADALSNPAGLDFFTLQTLRSEVAAEKAANIPIGGPNSIYTLVTVQTPTGPQQVQVVDYTTKLTEANGGTLPSGVVPQALPQITYVAPQVQPRATAPAGGTSTNTAGTTATAISQGAATTTAGGTSPVAANNAVIQQLRELSEGIGISPAILLGGAAVFLVLMMSGGGGGRRW